MIDIFGALVHLFVLLVDEHVVSFESNWGKIFGFVPNSNSLDFFFKAEKPDSPDSKNIEWHCSN